VRVVALVPNKTARSTRRRAVHGHNLAARLQFLDALCLSRDDAVLLLVALLELIQAVMNRVHIIPDMHKSCERLIRVAVHLVLEAADHRASGGSVPRLEFFSTWLKKTIH